MVGGIPPEAAKRKVGKRRLALWLWYRGERFRGFQTQIQGPTVQQVLQEALARAGVPATVHPAGRTDLGVHARMQVVSLRLPEGLAGELPERLAGHLPEGLGLCLAREAKAQFHAQWRCVGKEYRYRVALTPPPARWVGACWYPGEEEKFRRAPIAPERLEELLRRAEGRRDFWAFHGKSSPRQPRALDKAELRELEPGLCEVRLLGDRFARYQVRYLVGSALLVAAGGLPEEQYLAALEEAVEIRGHRAPGGGLTLWEVHYPPELDPFTPEQRQAPPNLPGDPPFN